MSVFEGKSAAQINHQLKVFGGGSMTKGIQRLVDYEHDKRRTIGFLEGAIWVSGLCFLYIIDDARRKLTKQKGAHPQMSCVQNVETKEAQKESV